MVPQSADMTVAESINLQLTSSAWISYGTILVTFFFHICNVLFWVCVVEPVVNVMYVTLGMCC